MVIIIFNGKRILSRKTIVNFSNSIRVTNRPSFIFGCHSCRKTSDLIQFLPDVDFVGSVHQDGQYGLSCTCIIYYLIREK
jgi:hypothetical protein